MNNTQISFNDIVFENRNRSFGAYVLRRFHEKHLITGFIISFLVFSLALAAPVIYNKLKPKEQSEMLEIREVNLELLPPPPSLNPATPPPPSVKFEAPKLNTVKFIPPVIKRDEEVSEQEKIATDEELKESVAGNVTEVNNVPSNPVTDNTHINILGEDEVFEQGAIEVWPEFPGGMTAFSKYLKKKITYNRLAEEKGIEGKVFISFVIKKDGSIDDVKIVRGLGYGLDENAKDVIKSMPAWNPGKNNGRSVSVRYNIPISYKLH